MNQIFPNPNDRANHDDMSKKPKSTEKPYIHAYEAEEDPDFSYDGFQVSRREYYAHITEPSISFSDGRLTINSACLKRAPDVEYVQILVNSETKKLVIRPCSDEDWDSFMWCTSSHKVRAITCRVFFAMIFVMMKWDPAHRYKILGKMIHHKDEYLFVFDLNSKQKFEREIVIDDDGKEHRKTSRTPIYSSEWQGKFGKPVEEHRQAVQINTFDGFAVYGLKDNRTPPTSQE